MQYILILIFYPGNDACINIVPGRYARKETAEAAGRAWAAGKSFYFYTVIPAPESNP